MARITVYVPDELLEHSRELERDARNVSQLVQRGLQRIVDEHAAVPTYATQPPNELQRLQSLQDRLAAEARREYEIGYAAALDTAAELSLAQLNGLAEMNFDVPKWLYTYRQAAADELEELADSIQRVSPYSNEYSPEFVYQQLRERGTPPADSSWGWVWRLARVLGKIADRVGFDESAFTPTKARLRGFTDAMRELWTAIETPDQPIAIVASANVDDERPPKGGGTSGT